MGGTAVLYSSLNWFRSKSIVHGASDTAEMFHATYGYTELDVGIALTNISSTSPIHPSSLP